MEKKTVGTIIVLFVVALLLGVIIFGEQGGGQPPLAGEPAATAPSPGSPAPVPVRPKPSTPAQPNAMAVLMFPAQNAGKEEQDAHRTLVDKLAQKAAFLDLTKCAPKPLVLAHTKGEDLSVKNQDTGADYILRLGKNDITIPAGKSVTVKASMIGLGTTGYACYMAGVPNPPIGTVGVIRSKEGG